MGIYVFVVRTTIEIKIVYIFWIQVSVRLPQPILGAKLLKLKLFLSVCLSVGRSVGYPSKSLHFLYFLKSRALHYPDLNIAAQFNSSPNPPPPRSTFKPQWYFDIFPLKCVAIFVRGLHGWLEGGGISVHKILIYIYR